MYGLPYGTLQQVVDAADHEQLVLIFLYVDDGLVGVHHLFHVGALRHEVGEGGILIVVGIDVLHLL